MNETALLSETPSDLSSSWSVVQLPSGWSGEAPGRVIVRHEGRLYAVRPADGCKTCLGSTAFRVRRAEKRVVCGCVAAQLGTPASPRTPGLRWAGSATPGAQVTYDAEAFRLRRIAEVTAERTAREAERAAEMGPIEAEVGRLLEVVNDGIAARRACDAQRDRMRRRLARLRAHAERASAVHRIIGESLERDGASLKPATPWGLPDDIRWTLADNAGIYLRMAAAAARRDYYELAAGRLRIYLGLTEQTIEQLDRRAEELVEGRVGPEKQHARAVERRDQAARKWSKKLRGFEQTLARLATSAQS